MNFDCDKEGEYRTYIFNEIANHVDIILFWDDVETGNCAEFVEEHKKRELLFSFSKIHEEKIENLVKYKDLKDNIKFIADLINEDAIALIGELRDLNKSPYQLNKQVFLRMALVLNNKLLGKKILRAPRPWLPTI